MDKNRIWNFKAFIGIILILLHFSLESFSQSLSSKDEKLLREAKISAAKGKYEDANKSLQKILKKNPMYAEGWARMGSNYFAMSSYQAAENAFKRSLESDSTFSGEVYFSLGMSQMKQDKYLDASKSFYQYYNSKDNQAVKREKAKRMAENMHFIHYAKLNPKPFHPINLGKGVNTQIHSEYSPSISYDEKSIIFTRNTGQEDMYIAQRDSTKSFQEAIPMEGLNSQQNEGAHAFSADGSFMVFTACDRKDSQGGCDLYYSVKQKNTWSDPKNFGSVVNSSAWDSQPTLSADGNALLFASTRQGGLGGSDIWMTTKQPNGAWKTPKNLGRSINTKYKDETPFLHADGKTLYFRSDGYPGMGDFDLYFSKFNDSLKDWETPVNLGYPINTFGDEGGLIVSLDGNSAYFASDYDPETYSNMGQLDIFSFELYKEARPIPTTFVKGEVLDAQTDKIIDDATIILKPLDTLSESITFLSDRNGAFLGSLTAGKRYLYHVLHKDYIFYSDYFDLSDLDTLYKPYLLKIRLHKLPQHRVKTDSLPDIPIVLKNIFFTSGSWALLNDSDHEIEQLFQLLQQNPISKIKIMGHTDNVGNDEDNLFLSQKRAEAVQEKLVSLGIDASRITAIGFGESKPIDDNETDIGRKNNRRTEFILY
ncbi:MAG: OmpA family protein [Saprospiraceae bacterium]